MKQYKSHKIVEAAPIHMAAVDDEGGCHVYLEPHGEHFAMPDGAFARGMPIPGDYFVRYQPDGYLSWSPKAVFEAGYTLVDQPEPSTTWQARLQSEAEVLDLRIEKLRAYLIGGPDIGAQDLALLQQQYAAMSAYADVLTHRMRLHSLISVETPPEVREDAAPLSRNQALVNRGAPAAVEVTVVAPVGKRAVVELVGAERASGWTVTAGQSQTWSVLPGETLGVQSAGISTVAHKRDNG